MSINEKLFNDKIKEIEKKIKINSPGFISLIGDRGFGKTSTLMNLYTKYENDKNNKNSNLIVLDPIDLKVVSENFTITLLLLSKIESYVENNIDSYSTKRELKCKLEEIIDILLQNKDEINYSYGSSEKVFEVLRKMYNFSKVISDIIEDICNNKGAEFFVILLDDFDLTYSNDISKIFDELLQFFDEEVNSKSSKLRLVFSYNEEQIIRALNETNFKNNSNLFRDEKNKDVNINRIKLHSNAIMKKAFPLNKKVYLPTMSNLYNLTNDEMPIFSTDYINSINCKESDIGEKTIRDLLESSIEQVFENEWIPFNSLEGKENIYPNSLRALYQFIEVLSLITNSEDSIEKKIITNDSKIEFVEILMKEINTNAKLDDLTNQYLSSDDNSINATLYNGVLKIINNIAEDEKATYLEALNKIITNKGTTLKSINDFKIKVIDNVSIGDVLDVFNIYSTYCIDERDIKYIYYIKLHYSLKIKRTILKIEKMLQKNENIDRLIEKYQKYFNGSVLPKSKFCNDNDGFNNEISLSHFNNGTLNSDISKNLLIYSITTHTSSKSKYYYSSHPFYSAENTNKAINNVSLYSNRKEIEEKIKDNLNKRNMKDMYTFDPYNILTTKNYIENAIEKKQYILYSVFDIDIFATIDLSRNDHKNKFLNIFNNLNNSLQNQYDEKKTKFDQYNRLKFINGNDNGYTEILQLLNMDRKEFSDELRNDFTYDVVLNQKQKQQVICLLSYFITDYKKPIKTIGGLNLKELDEDIDSVYNSAKKNGVFKNDDNASITNAEELVDILDIGKIKSTFIEILFSSYNVKDEDKGQVLLKISALYSKNNTDKMVNNFQKTKNAVSKVDDLIQKSRINSYLNKDIEVEEFLKNCKNK